MSGRTEVEILERIETLLTALVSNGLKAEIEAVQKDAKLRKVWSLTGTKTVREIAEATGIPRATVSGVWQRWERAGLIVKKGKQFVKTF